MIQLPSDDVDLVGIEVPVLEKLKKASVLEGPEEEIYSRPRSLVKMK